MMFEKVILPNEKVIYTSFFGKYWTQLTETWINYDSMNNAPLISRFKYSSICLFSCKDQKHAEWYLSSV